MKLSGQCLCGKVGFRLEGWVSRIQACHAERCRKATGGLYSPEIAASSENFEWIGETSLISTYEAPLLSEPPAYRRNFCSNCGSPLPCELEGADMVVVQAGILDDCKALQVFRHAFVEQKSGCCEITDGKPEFAGKPPTPAPSDLLE